MNTENADIVAPDRSAENRDSGALELADAIPVLRVITTSLCNFRCHYCPPDNETFPSSVVAKGSHRFIDFAKLPILLNASIQTGIRRISFIGGEPLLTSHPVEILAQFAKDYPLQEWVLQTNGVKLLRHLPVLSTIRNLTLKVSLDVFDCDAFKAVCGIDAFNTVVTAIREARIAHMKVGINVVLIRESLEYIPAIIDFARDTGCYVKFLDLNWYIDVGARKNSLPLTDDYWIQHYVSPRRHLMPLLKAKGISEFQIRRNHTYGIPVIESQHEHGFFVRIKDSSAGTTYAPICMQCPHFVSRKCQEGIYELSLTPDFRLKICRHRPDIEYAVDPGVCTEAEIARAIRVVLAEIYRPARHYDIDTSSWSRYGCHTAQ